MANSELNERQQLFCIEYIKDFNATQAYIRAGYSAKTAEQAASTMLRNIKVQKEISRLTKKVMAKAEKKTGLTIESWLKDLETIKKRCMTAEPVMEFDREEKKMVETGEFKFDSSGALKASDQQGRYMGTYEKDNTKTIKVKTIEDYVFEELIDFNKESEK